MCVCVLSVRSVSCEHIYTLCTWATLMRISAQNGSCGEGLQEEKKMKHLFENDFAAENVSFWFNFQTAIFFGAGNIVLRSGRKSFPLQIYVMHHTTGFTSMNSPFCVYYSGGLFRDVDGEGHFPVSLQMFANLFKANRCFYVLLMQRKKRSNRTPLLFVRYFVQFQWSYFCVCVHSFEVGKSVFSRTTWHG